MGNGYWGKLLRVDLTDRSVTEETIHESVLMKYIGGTGLASKIIYDEVSGDTDAFDPEKASLEEMKAHYRRGGLGDGVVKKRLNEVLQILIKPIRERREQFAKDLGEVMKILRIGSESARAVATQTLSEVREAMLLNHL